MASTSGTPQEHFTYLKRKPTLSNFSRNGSIGWPLFWKPKNKNRNMTMAENSLRSLLRRAIVVAGCISLFALTNPALAEDFVELPQDLEIELALSALPEELRADATVYVRDPKKGFVVHRQGLNDWTTFVARTSVRFFQADWEYAYPSDQLIPMAYDKVGQAHNVIPYFDIERLRIEGVPAAETKQIIRQRYADGTYTAPKQGGLSYMFAPIHRAYSEPAKSNLITTSSFPHHMPYAPHMNAAKVGAMDPYGRSGILDHGSQDSGAHGYMYFLVQPDQAEAIRASYSDLLTKLCKHHSNWCLRDTQQPTKE